MLRHLLRVSHAFASCFTRTHLFNVSHVFVQKFTYVLGISDACVSRAVCVHLTCRPVLPMCFACHLHTLCVLYYTLPQASTVYASHILGIYAFCTVYTFGLHTIRNNVPPEAYVRYQI